MKNSFGGLVAASLSCLNAVSTIQNTGKKNPSPTSQATTPHGLNLRLFFFDDGGRHACGCRDVCLNCAWSFQAASSLPENDLKINRSAKLAMIIVKMTTTTPIAAAWPMSKPRNARW